MKNFIVLCLSLILIGTAFQCCKKIEPPKPVIKGTDAKEYTYTPGVEAAYQNKMYNAYDSSRNTFTEAQFSAPGQCAIPTLAYIIPTWALAEEKGKVIWDSSTGNIEVSYQHDSTSYNYRWVFDRTGTIIAEDIGTYPNHCSDL